MRTVTTRSIAGRVNTDGSPATGGFSSRKAATGDYTITFPPDFRLGAMTANSSVQTCIALVSFPAPGQARVLMLVYNTAAGADTQFSFVATGSS